MPFHCLENHIKLRLLEMRRIFHLTVLKHALPYICFLHLNGNIGLENSVRFT